jgi:hypothetical protein
MIESLAWNLPKCSVDELCSFPNRFDVPSSYEAILRVNIDSTKHQIVEIPLLMRINILSLNIHIIIFAKTQVIWKAHYGNCLGSVIEY